MPEELKQACLAWAKTVSTETLIEYVYAQAQMDAYVKAFGDVTNRTGVKEAICLLKAQ
jgi:hypothetical protein